jgi:hypothetical protein
MVSVAAPAPLPVADVDSTTLIGVAGKISAVWSAVSSVAVSAEAGRVANTHTKSVNNRSVVNSEPKNAEGDVQ